MSSPSASSRLERQSNLICFYATDVGAVGAIAASPIFAKPPIAQVA
ncbi:MAG: hypothetical protein F6J87_21590 [Spirulina sp. SIO3F2]|nr:hypothetical protein [Spirulina sp. SIO3F2]